MLSLFRLGSMQLNDSELTVAERAEFQDWLLADETHAQEFRAHTAVVTLAQQFPPQLRERLEALDRVEQSEQRSARPRLKWGMGLAAAVLAAIIALWVVQPFKTYPPELYFTKTGQTRIVRLADHSVAHLNTQTEIVWQLSSRERRVELRSGEVLFDVARDDKRPFRVVLDNSVITVVGTRFNVYRKKNAEVVVTVFEGKVTVNEAPKKGVRTEWRRDLKANQQLVYQPLGLLKDVQNSVDENQDVLGWRKGVVEFTDIPLPEALDELSRYTEQRIVIRDPRLAQLRIGGTFNVRNIKDALTRLEILAPVRVSQSGDGYALEYRD
jgi:transmembrane sensor